MAKFSNVHEGHNRHRVERALGVIAQSFGKLWLDSKSSPFVSFKRTIERYLGVTIEAETHRDYQPPTPDRNFIHSHLAKSLDAQLTRRVFQNNRVSGLDNSLRLMAEAVIKACLTPYRNQTHDDIVRLIRAIWGQHTIYYSQDESKKNAQLYQSVISLMLASIAYYAGIDNTYQPSRAFDIPLKHFKNWSSPCAISMGLDNYRVTQKNASMGQLSLLWGISQGGGTIKDYIERDSHTLSNTQARNAADVLRVCNRIVKCDLFARVTGSHRDFWIEQLFETDHNGWGVNIQCTKPEAEGFAKKIISAMMPQLLSERSVQFYNRAENCRVNARLLTNGLGIAHDVKMSFMGVFNKTFANGQNITRLQIASNSLDS